MLWWNGLTQCIVGTTDFMLYIVLDTCNTIYNIKWTDCNYFFISLITWTQTCSVQNNTILLQKVLCMEKYQLYKHLLTNSLAQFRVQSHSSQFHITIQSSISQFSHQTQQQGKCSQPACRCSSYDLQIHQQARQCHTSQRSVGSVPCSWSQ